MTMIKYLLSDIRKDDSLYFSENEPFQQTNIIQSKILKHKKETCNKTEYIQTDKDAMLRKIETLAMASEKLELQDKLSHGRFGDMPYLQVIYWGQNISIL